VTVGAGGNEQRAGSSHPVIALAGEAECLRGIGRIASGEHLQVRRQLQLRRHAPRWRSPIPLIRTRLERVYSYGLMSRCAIAVSASFPVGSR